MATHNLGPCGCCAVFDCECYDIEPTELKITLSGFTGACAAWNGEYFSAAPSRAIIGEDFGDINMTIIQGCADDFWGLAVSVSVSEFCSFTYEVLEVAEDPRFSCGGGTLEVSDMTGSDTTTCSDCGPGTITVEYTF